MTVPQELLETQRWFGSIIERPIDINSRMNPISPSGVSMEEEAKAYILPSPTLMAHERIQIYNQQYWWRLLSILHENLPLLVRLFGYVDFNQTIGFPYLTDHPPDSWSLNPLGSKVVEWLEKNYDQEDRDFVIDAAHVDVAYNDGFTALQLPPLSQEDNLYALLEIPLRLQPSASLYRFDSHLFPFRQTMLQKEPDYWEEHDFPKLAKGAQVCTLLYRNKKLNLTFEEIHPSEHFLLSLFQKGTTIAQACDALEAQPSFMTQEAEAKLPEWFQKWALRGLLAKS